MSLFGILAHSDEPTMRQGETVWDANIADHILPFDGKYQPADVENNSVDLTINRNVALSEQSSRVEGTQNGKESEESAFVYPRSQRTLSKPIHDVSKTALVDVIPSIGSACGPVLSRVGLRDANGSLFDSNHTEQKTSPSSVQRASRSSPDNTQMAVDVSDFDSRSCNAENMAGLSKIGYADVSLQVLTSVVSQVHFVDTNRTFNDESTDVILGKANLLSHGCLNSENANRNDDVNAAEVETDSQCLQGNNQGEAEKGLIKAVNECYSSQIVTGGGISDIQNNIEHNAEVRAPKMSASTHELQACARISTVSSGIESNNPMVSVHGISVSDPTTETGGSAAAESFVNEISLANLFNKSSVDAPKPQTACTNELQKVDEDAILAEAVLIEVGLLHIQYKFDYYNFYSVPLKFTL